MTTNLYFTGGFMFMFHEENQLMRSYLMNTICSNTGKNRTLLNGYHIWVRGIHGENIEDLAKNVGDDIDFYYEVRSNFIDGQTDGYTHMKRGITHGGRVIRNTIEEGTHKLGKKVGRNSTKTIHTNDNVDHHNINDNIVTIKYEEFNDDHRCECVISNNEISFYCVEKDIRWLKYSNTATSEQIFFKKMIYLLMNNTSYYSLITKCDYHTSSYIRRISNNDGVVKINDKTYSANGTIVTNTA